MRDIFENSAWRDYMYVPYEIKKWLFEYEIVSHYIHRLKDDIDLYRVNIDGAETERSLKHLIDLPLRSI